MKRLYADAGLLLVALIWGATFPVVKLALNFISPFAFNAIRFVFTSLLFLPFLKRREASAGVKIGVASFLGYTFQTIGLELTTATNAGFITSTYIVFTPIIAAKLYGEKLTRVEALSVIVAFIGVYLLSGVSSFNTGDALILLCAIAFAFEIAMISEYSKKLQPLSLAGWQVLSIGLFSTFPALFFTEKLVLNDYVLLSLLITGLLATFVAKILQNYLQSYTKSVDAGIILSLEGVFSHVFSVIVLGETLSALQYLGAFLVFLAAILVSSQNDKS
ncbi:protein of unknown function DUF6 transmembrane [Ferroglobus placidus DSM 10642]|uniref:EamA domain-containing protein n=1 Tax=Ferroglobus placidus (strain DSM 10642 / AEDII12DO) TaxID=589924 RepID=D3S005_FERPA|nr:DMT family transporter [Ferroglobus placidus]ADC66068.1 protein of unknown function DUF6 transmembrane [Ferroglobus placidus DSM 10642]